MILIRFSLVFIFLWMGLTACEHKDLCYDHPHFATVRVVFDWTKISNHDKPEGMRVVFYPTDDESNTWIFDFPGGEDGEVELPENDYRVICFNYDTDGMVWKENGSYTLFTADTRDVRSPDNQTMAVTPPWLCGDHIDRVILKDIPEGSTKVIRLTPVNMVCHYTYEVNGIRGLDRVADLRAALSGMSGSLNMSGDSLPADLSESLLFDGMVSRNQIIGGFYTFGHSALEGEPNVFRLYLKNTNLKNTDFDVFAFTADGTAFMGKNDTEFAHDGVKIVYKNGKWDYDNASDLRYWPTEALDFYAFNPGTVSEDMMVFYSWEATKDVQKISYTCMDEYGAGTHENYDVMYAMAKGQTKDMNNGIVKFNFKHIL